MKFLKASKYLSGFTA